MVCIDSVAAKTMVADSRKRADNIRRDTVWQFMVLLFYLRLIYMKTKICQFTKV